VASQEVGSQAGSVAAAQAAVQQLPVPARPQISEVQSSSSVQLPTAVGFPQVPALQTKSPTQSALPVQVVTQAVALWHARLWAQGLWAPAAQVPEPLHVPAEVRRPLLQAAAPHEAPEAG
jgi:hypothetical protein